MMKQRTGRVYCAAVRAVFLDFATLNRGDLDLSRLRAVVPQITLHEVTPEGRIDERIVDAEIIVTNKLRITRERIARNASLRLIVLAATGTDNVDLEAARERGVAVCNVRNYCTTSVMQHVLAVLLHFTHRPSEFGRLAVDGSWARSPQFTMLNYPIRELGGRMLGIVGYGTLGRAVGDAARAALGMEVRIANRPGAPAAADRLSLDQLLAQADVVSLHCPLTAATRNLIAARELALMKPDSLLINTARGGLIDAAALAAALRAGRPGAAAIDVLTQEPPVESNPLLDPTVPNLLVTPHIAWSAFEARQRCLDQIAANVEEFLRGGSRNRVV